MRRVICTIVFVFLLAPSAPAFAIDLPKCRNVAGYEPKRTCEARNQRAQWQAQQTAQITAQLVGEALMRQAEANRENEISFMDTLKGAYEGAVKTVAGFF